MNKTWRTDLELIRFLLGRGRFVRMTDRQRESELRSSLEVALHRDPSAMSLDQFLCDWQTKAKPLENAPSASSSVETIEDVCKRLFVHLLSVDDYVD